MKRRRVSRTLVLCPSILRHQWIEELESKVGIIGRTAVGQELDRELRGRAPVVVTTYESARFRLNKIAPTDFDLIILDEAHKLRNLHGTQKAPLIAEQLHRVLERRLFKYVLMLTATPIQNRLWDLYSLIDCLTVAKGHKIPLGTPGQFAAEYIADGQAARNLRPGTQEKFRAALRKYIVRTSRRDAQLSFPDRKVEMFRVTATPVERELQRILAGRIRSATNCFSFRFSYSSSFSRRSSATPKPPYFFFHR